jgi:hypothetical protein
VSIPHAARLVTCALTATALRQCDESSEGTLKVGVGLGKAGAWPSDGSCRSSHGATPAHWLAERRPILLRRENDR